VGGLKAENSDGEGAVWMMLSGAGALVLGPSLGHYYAGDMQHGVATTFGRLAGGGLVFFGLVLDRGFCSTGDCRGGIGTAATVAGAGLFVYSTVYDIVDAPRAARRFNDRVQVMPTVLPTATGAAPGVFIGGTF
jgi:hypothetical protein